jgi:hypothetical protein
MFKLRGRANLLILALIQLGWRTILMLGLHVEKLHTCPQTPHTQGASDLRPSAKHTFVQ